MLFVVWVPLLLQLAVPLGLLLWLAFGRPRDVVSWLVRVILVTCYVVAVGAAGLWLVLPWYTPLIYGVALLLAIAHSLPQRTLPVAPSGRGGMAAVLLLGSLATFCAGLASYILLGWRTPSDAVELSFPLRGGTYLVVNGGWNELINAPPQDLEGRTVPALERAELQRRHREGEPLWGSGLAASCRPIRPATPSSASRCILPAPVRLLPRWTESRTCRHRRWTGSTWPVTMSS